jgi:SET domain
LGMGMIFNHHPTAPNVEYTTFGREPAPDVPNAANAIGFRALRDIAVGEELFSTYGKEDGGEDWFSRRQMERHHPMGDDNERKIHNNLTERILLYQQQYCSKIAAGLGRSTWKNRILPLLPASPSPHVPFWLDDQWLPPIDAEMGSAYAKVDIYGGERIERGTGMIVSQHRHLKGTALDDLAWKWDDLELDHQESLRILRHQGQWMLQVNEWTTNSSWNRIDGFLSWEDVAILPIGGNIGLVGRRRRHDDDDDGDSAAPTPNCRLVIPTTTTMMMEPQPHGGDPAVMVPLDLIATRDIATGERLWLNIPYSSYDRRTNVPPDQEEDTTTPDPVTQLHNELKAMGRLPPDNTRYGVSKTKRVGKNYSDHCENRDPFDQMNNHTSS